MSVIWEIERGVNMTGFLVEVGTGVICEVGIGSIPYSRSVCN